MIINEGRISFLLTIIPSYEEYVNRARLMERKLIDMIINDNGREFDVEKIDKYSFNTQRLIKRLIYLRYVYIRDLLSPNCCSKMKLNAVREAIQEEKNVNRIKETFGYSLEEINFYIDYADQNIPMVR